MDIFLNAYPSPQDSHHNENLSSAKILEEDSMDCIQEPTSDPLIITDLPPEIMHHIFRYLSFDTISKLRKVCSYFNEICSSMLNSEFNQLRTLMLQKFQAIKAMMPRRESARRKHPLARESDIIETLHMRLSLLQMTFGKHMEQNYCCFFPGEIIDEIYRILKYIKSTPTLNRAYKVTDELFDLSTMAMEYFKEHIEPSLPEITYLAHDLLEHSPFITPGPDLLSQRAQLMQLECTNIRKEAFQPKNNCVTKLQKQLDTTTEMARRNNRDVIRIQQTLKSIKKKVNTMNSQLEEIQWKQNISKKILYSNLNYLHLKRHKQLILKSAFLPNCSSNKSCMSELFPENSDSISCETMPSYIEKIRTLLSKNSTTITCIPERIPSDIENIRTILSKASTTITCIPVDGSNENVDCSLKLLEKSQLDSSNENYDSTDESLTEQQTICNSG